MKRDDVDLPFLEWVTSGLDWSTSPPTEVVPNASRIDLAIENTGVVILVSKVDDTPLSRRRARDTDQHLRAGDPTHHRATQVTGTRTA